MNTKSATGPDPSGTHDELIWYGWDDRKASDFAERFGESMRHIEALSERLREEAHREYVEREAEAVEGGDDAGAK